MFSRRGRLCKARYLCAFSNVNEECIASLEYRRSLLISSMELVRSCWVPRGSVGIWDERVHYNG